MLKQRSAPVERHCDTLVIGTGLGGLISGAILARRGRKVFVLNQEQVPLSVTQNGFRLPRERPPGPRFKRHLFEIIFEELGLQHEERALFARERPVYQVIQDHHRTDIFGDRAALLEEMRREFPRHVDAIQRFYRFIDEKGANRVVELSRDDLLRPLSKAFWRGFSKRTREDTPLLPILKSFNLPGDFQQNIVAQINALSHIHTDQPSLDQALTIFADSQRKDYFFQGAQEELEEIFLRRIREAGGEYRSDGYAERLLCERRRSIAGTRVNTYEGTFHAGNYIGNIEIHRLFDLLPEARGKMSGLGPEPDLLRRTFYLGVKTNVIPVGLRSRCIILRDGAASLVGENMIRLEWAQVAEDPEKTLLQVSYFIPYPSETNARSQTQLDQEAGVHQAVLKRLEHLIPFLSNHQIMVHPDPARSEDSWNSYSRDAWLHGVRDWSLAPISRFRSTPPLRNETRFENLYFTGPEVFPTLGFEGELISAVNTANSAASRTGANDRR